jgi:hypothetical protein
MAGAFRANAGDSEEIAGSAKESGEKIKSPRL